MIKEVYFNELRESHPEGSDSKAFTADNTAFKEDLAAQGVVMDETGNRFKFIHLNGAHAPFIYDKDANVIGVEQGSYRQSMEASITLAANYIQALKDSGAYDNTALIVMADHGYNGMGEKEEDFLRQAALLLIKGRNEQHDTMQISEAPISYEDLQEAYVRLLDGAQSDAVFDWKEGDTRETFSGICSRQRETHGRISPERPCTGSDNYGAYRKGVRPVITFPAIEAAGMIPTSAKRLSMLWLRLSPRTKYSPGASVRGAAALPASSMREKPSGVGWGTPLT